MKTDFTKTDVMKNAAVKNTAVKKVDSISVAEKYLLFKISDRFFAFPSRYVSETCHIPPVTKLPFVPDFIKGLISIKGNIIPLIDSSMLLTDKHSDQQKFCIRIIANQMHFAITADALVDEKEISAADIKKCSDDGNSAALTAIVAGEMQMGSHCVFVLDHAGFSDLIPASAAADGSGGLLGDIVENEQFNTDVRLLVFTTAGENFAIALENVYRVMEAETIRPAQGMHDCVTGLAMMDGQGLLVLSFESLIGRERNDSPMITNILVVERAGTFYGIDIPSHLSINSFETSRIRESASSNDQFSAIVTDSQNNVSSIVTANELISEALHEKLKKIAPVIKTLTKEIAQTQQALLININDQDFAFPVDFIRRILPYRKIAKMVDHGQKIHGVIDVEGQIIPVLDASSQLGAFDIDDASNKFVVIGNESQQWAIAVSRAKEIIDIPVSDIDTVNSDDYNHLCGMARYSGNILPLINLRQLAGTL